MFPVHTSHSPPQLAEQRMRLATIDRELNLSDAWRMTEDPEVS
jgi:hypothetical protein